MCDIATAGLIIGAVSGVGSAMQQRSIGRQNAALARREAAQQEEIGRFEEQRARTRMDRLISQQRAQFTARGVRLDSASAERLGSEAAIEAGLEAQAQRFNTDSQVGALNTEAELAESRGRMGFLTGMLNTGARTITGGLKLWPELAGT